MSTKERPKNWRYIESIRVAQIICDADYKSKFMELYRLKHSEDYQIIIIVFQDNGDGTITKKTTTTININNEKFPTDIKIYLSSFLHIPVDYIELKFHGSVMNDAIYLHLHNIENQSTLHCFIPNTEKLKRSLKSIALKPGLFLVGTCKNETCLMFNEKIRLRIGMGVFCYSRPPLIRCMHILCKDLIVSEEFGFYNCRWKMRTMRTNNEWRDTIDDSTDYFQWQNEIKDAGSIVIKATNTNIQHSNSMHNLYHRFCFYCNGTCEYKNQHNIYLEPGDNCAICLESLCDCKLKTLKCGHVFHFECVEKCQITSMKCALCRK